MMLHNAPFLFQKGTTMGLNLCCTVFLRLNKNDASYECLCRCVCMPVSACVSMSFLEKVHAVSWAGKSKCELRLSLCRVELIFCMCLWD